MTQDLKEKKIDWLTWGQFLFSTFAGLTLIGFSLTGIFLTLVGGSYGIVPISESQLGSSLLFAAGLGFAGFLMIPSVIYSSLTLFGKPSTKRFAWIGSGWLLFPLMVLIFFGYLSQGGTGWGRYILPVLHILSNAVGVFWILSLLFRKLPGENAQRFWGAFGSGLTFAPLIALIVEITIMIFIGLVWIVILQGQPALKQEIISLADRLQQSYISPPILERTLRNVILHPGISATIFIYIAVLVPLVEEIIKPLAVWLMLRRNLSPREGFLIGGIAGAGYAMFENLTIGADADFWAAIIISRLGTIAMHILTTGLVGYGLASAVTEKRYPRFAGAFFAAVFLHGVWNGLNILTAIKEITPEDTLVTFGSTFADFAPAGLFILAAGAFLGIVRANAFFQRAIMTQEI